MKYREGSIVISTICFVTLLCVVFLSGSCTKKSEELSKFMSHDCTQCHSANAKYSVKGTTAGYEASGHKLKGNAFYANEGACSQCHTHEGFVQYTEKGSVDPKALVSNPSQPGCHTCHDAHKYGNFDLRTVKPVKLASGEEFDHGKGNLCASCHQVRGKAQEAAVEMDSAKVLPHYGPHHGPQADMLAGTGAFEYSSKTYANSRHTTVIKDSCVDCHMTLPKGRYGLSAGIGGHSFNLQGHVHEELKLNTAGCIACHKDIKQVKGKAVFDKLAAADYDNDGNTEPLQDEVQGLLNKLVNTNGSGLLQKKPVEMFKDDGTFQVSRKGKRSAVQMAALFNYKFVSEDRSLGVHNSKYALQILYDTIASINPDFDVSKRPE